MLRQLYLWCPALITVAAAATVTITSDWAQADAPPPDRYRITLDSSLPAVAGEGRIMLFFITERGEDWDEVDPVNGPFYQKPQPIASIPIRDMQPGQTAIIDRSSVSFPESLDALHGPARVQAILDIDHTLRSHLSGPGNVYSDVISIDLDAQRAQTFDLVLRHRIEGPRPLPEETPLLKWIEQRSELLSDFYGRDVYHRAGVALPPNYHDDASRREWPAVYVIPGFGGRHSGAVQYAEMYESIGIEQVAPMAVYIVLDPDAPLGHHGFMDSANNGPRGTALINEFIPYLESQFRIAPRTEARIVTGHSSGGWSSLWLQLRWPDVFGACWSTAPDPVSFMAFQYTNIYNDENMYTFAPGYETPSYREYDMFDREMVRMSVREEALMEHAMHPLGGSGEQWDAWEAMFSPRDPETGFPVPLFDRKTGRIDPETAEYWKQFDITMRTVRNWDQYGPIFGERVRLFCGTFDSFYLERAVEMLKDWVALMNRETSYPGDGYIELIPKATHGSLRGEIFMRINEEMRAYLRQHNLHD